jgi:hypothetical protein
MVHMFGSLPRFVQDLAYEDILLIIDDSFHILDVCEKHVFV